MNDHIGVSWDATHQRSSQRSLGRYSAVMKTASMAALGLASHVVMPLVLLAALASAVWLAFHGLWALVLWNILFCFLGALALGLGALLAAGVGFIANKVFRPRIAGALVISVMYFSAWTVVGSFLGAYVDLASKIPVQWVPLILMGGGSAMVPFAGAARAGEHVRETQVLINTAQGSAAIATIILLFRLETVAWAVFSVLLFVGYLIQLSETTIDLDDVTESAA